MHTRQEWEIKAAALSFDGRIFADGQWHASQSEVQIQTINPADGQPSVSFTASRGPEVDFVVATARAAFDEGRWSDLSPRQRRCILLRFAELIEANSVELALCDSLDVGKPIMQALGEVPIAAAFVRYYAEALDKHYTGQTVPTCKYSLEIQLMRPRGVVASIAPWNFPLVNTALKIAPALAAGNCVVVKPSSVSPRSAERLAMLGLEAGLPPGVLNVLPGDGHSGDLLVRHAGVDMVTFTGSTETGRKIMRAIGDSTLKPMLLECGGKNPEFVFDDMAGTDLDGIAANILGWAFANVGQLCVARSRLYIQDKLYTPLLERIVAQAQGMRAGHPLDPQTRFGPLSTAAQRDVTAHYISKGLEEGGELLVDGRLLEGAESGFYMGPSLFAGLGESSAVNIEEIFGPVLSINRFKDAEDAIRLANSNEYGLAATVWTRDIATAQRLTTAIASAKVRVMASPVSTEGSGLNQSAEPARQSGFGVEGGLRGMESYMRRQVVEYSFG